MEKANIRSHRQRVLSKDTLQVQETWHVLFRVVIPGGYFGDIKVQALIIYWKNYDFFGVFYHLFWRKSGYTASGWSWCNEGSIKDTSSSCVYNYRMTLVKSSHH